MSLTVTVKDELAHATTQNAAQRRAEVAAMLRFSGGLHLVSGKIVVFVDPGNWLPPSVDKSPAWRRALSKSLQTVGLLPEDAGKHLVKRVIGVGGDRVACCTAAGKLRVNGKEITETYLKPGVNPSEISFDVTVPKGKLWVMGDNRSNSRDSRYHIGERNGGFVPVDNVAGRAWAIFYPFSRFGSIDDASKVFAGVP